MVNENGQCIYCHDSAGKGTVHMCDPRLLREKIDSLKADLQEMTCGDPRYTAEMVRLRTIAAAADRLLIGIHEFGDLKYLDERIQALDDALDKESHASKCAHDINYFWSEARAACIKCGETFMKAIYCDTKEPHQLEPGEWCSWGAVIYAHCPGPGRLVANLASHDCKIPTLGMLTVSPSILCTDGAAGHRFHGFIENGIWLGEDRQPVKDSQHHAND